MFVVLLFGTRQKLKSGTKVAPPPLFIRLNWLDTVEGHVSLKHGNHVINSKAVKMPARLKFKFGTELERQKFKPFQNQYIRNAKTYFFNKKSIIKRNCS